MKTAIMKDKVISVLIGLFWVAVASYLIYKGLTIVVILSLILMGMTMAFATSNEN